MNTVFVYHKNDEIKVLDLETAKKLNDKLLKEEWNHTATLDPCAWIECLFNLSEDTDIIAEVRGLSKTLQF